MDFEEYEDAIEYSVTEDKISCEYGHLDYDIDGEDATVYAINVYRTGEGIGTKLVELFEDAVLKEKANYVSVPATPSKEAISFWKKMKYKPSGDDDKLLGAKDNAKLERKHLGYSARRCRNGKGIQKKN